MNYLADTDWVVDFLKGRAPAVAFINGLLRQGLAISAITFAEVYEGIYYGGKRANDEQVLERFLRSVPILDVTREVARQFAMTRGALRQQRVTVAPPDLPIAATAIHHDLILATRNVRHYDRIHGLKLLIPSS